MTTNPSSEKATLFVISAPSGAGKTSLVKALLDSAADLQVSISHTTRAKRAGEIDGQHYHFIDQVHFDSMASEGIFLESARVFDFHYGTSKQWVSNTLTQGTDVILEIDWQGAQQIADAIDCVTIFILPPSIQALKQRLENRSQDSADIIDRRMAKAKDEMARFSDANYVVINDNFDTAVHELKSIIQAERCKTSVQKEKLAGLIEQLLK